MAWGQRLLAAGQQSSALAHRQFGAARFRNNLTCILEHTMQFNILDCHPPALPSRLKFYAVGATRVRWSFRSSAISLIRRLTRLSINNVHYLPELTISPEYHIMCMTKLRNGLWKHCNHTVKHVLQEYQLEEQK